MSVGTDSRYNSIAYDAHGNTTTLGSDTMTYDISDRHLTTTTGSTTVTYTRDATDRIISRTDGTNVTHYSYSGAGDSPSVILDSANTTILDKTLPLLGGASMDVRGGTTTWNYSNIHGDVTAQANSSGTKVGSTATYDPFGQPLTTSPDNATGNFDYSWLGSKTRLTEHEGSLNTVEMGTRQYVAGLGRFIEVDPVEGGSANDYDYVNGEPIHGLDLDGKAKKKAKASAIAFGTMWNTGGQIYWKATGAAGSSRAKVTISVYHNGESMMKPTVLKQGANTTFSKSGGFPCSGGVWEIVVNVDGMSDQALDHKAWINPGCSSRSCPMMKPVNPYSFNFHLRG